MSVAHFLSGQLSPVYLINLFTLEYVICEQRQSAACAKSERALLSIRPASIYQQCCDILLTVVYQVTLYFAMPTSESFLEST